MILQFFSIPNYTVYFHMEQDQNRQFRYNVKSYQRS